MGIAHSTRIMGMTYGGQLNGNMAMPCLEDAYRRFEAIDDKRGMALVQLCIGFDYNNWDSPHTSPRQLNERKLESFRKSHALFREIGNDWGVGVTLENLAGYADKLGDHASARRLRVEHLKFTRQRESLRGERLWDIYSRATARQDWKTVKRALILLAEIVTKQNDAREMVRLLDRFVAYYLQGEGKTTKATELLGAARAAAATAHLDEFNRSLDASGDALLADLGDIAYRSVLHIGSTMSPAQAVALATSEL